MDVGLTWTDCDEAGDYVVPNVLGPRDLVSRPDNMDETVLHTYLFYLLNVCLFDLMLYVHRKHMRSCLDSYLFYW